jgi:hypothetical protein
MRVGIALGVLTASLITSQIAIAQEKGGLPEGGPPSVQDPSQRSLEVLAEEATKQTEAVRQLTQSMRRIEGEFTALQRSRMPLMREEPDRDLHRELPPTRILGREVDRTSTEQGLSPMEIVVALSAVVLTITVVGIVALLRIRRVLTDETTFKLIGLMLTLGTSLFLIGAGYGQEQIASVMAFLGTALGFIFGRHIGSVTSPSRDDSAPLAGPAPVHSPGTAP